MSDDIVTRLRKKLVMEALGDKATYLTLGDCLDAADEIERLRAENKRLRQFADDLEMAAEIDRLYATRRILALEQAVRGE